MTQTSLFTNKKPNAMNNKLLILILIFIITSCSQKPRNGYELIEQMYEAHKSNWYETLCFSQEVLHYKNDTIAATEVWHEAYRSPGNLIIKFNNPDNATGILLINDTVFNYRDGTLESVRYYLHDLIVLGFDINNIPPETTAERALKCDYDLNRLAEGQCMGRDAWIVGDTLGTCFWVDKKSLLFLKMRRLSGDNSREVEFARYDTVNGYPVATEIRFYDNEGALSMIEKYFNITPDCELSPAIFSPSEFNNAKW